MSKSTIGSTGLIAFDDAKVGHKITFFEQSERIGTRKENRGGNRNESERNRNEIGTEEGGEERKERGQKSHSEGIVRPFEGKSVLLRHH